jgi:hypothetical protein
MERLQRLVGVGVGITSGMSVNRELAIFGNAPDEDVAELVLVNSKASWLRTYRGDKTGNPSPEFLL